MSRILVVGAGGIGTASAVHLLAAGHDVIVATRSGEPGRDPLAGAHGLALDATDAAALTRATRGCDALVNAVNPPQYTRWERDWPPLAAAFLEAAQATGAGLVTVSNLYGYGQVTAPMTEATPLRPNGSKGRVRAAMWEEALAAHEAGRLRATEVRASDYFGPGARSGVSMLNRFVIAPAARGRTARLVVGVPDAPHSWTYLADVGALVATLATDDRAWGRPWHVPTAPPRTMAQVAADVAGLCGIPAPTVRPLPGAVRAAMRVIPLIRELDETRHQFERPFVLDSRAATATFGLAATPWREALAATLAHGEVGTTRVAAGSPR